MKKIIILFVSITCSTLSSCSNEEKIPTEETLKIRMKSSLKFEKLIDLGDNYFEDQTLGFVSNTSNNSLYISCRDKFKSATETTYKFDTKTINLTTKYTTLSDFVTKRNHIYNNELYVFGASGFTKYDLELTQNQPIITYGSNKTFSRFGTAMNNETLYIVGGFLGGEDPNQPNYDKKIWKYNVNTKLLELESTMPKNRNGGSSEIVKNKIYTFFGYEKINNPNSTTTTIELLNDVEIYNLKTKDFENITLPSNVKVSFTAVYNNYIFVAGNKNDGGFSSPINGSFFGYFDTNTKKLVEIPIEVSENTYDFPYISEIEILNDKIYAIVRNTANAYSIQVANLQ